MTFKIMGKVKIDKMWDFPGGPVVRTLHFHSRGHKPCGIVRKKKDKMVEEMHTERENSHDH